MKSPRSLLLALALLTLSTWLSWTLTPASETNPQSGNSPAIQSPRSPSAHRPPAGHLSPSQASMRAIRATNSELNRMKGAIALARSIPLSEAGRWLDEGLFSQREGAALTLFTKILEERWRREDPTGLLAWKFSVNRFASESEIVALAESDPDALLATLEAQASTWTQLNTLATLADSHPELVLSELTPERLRDFNPGRQFARLCTKLAVRDPAGLDAALERFPDDLHTAAITSIYRQKLRENMAATLPQLVAEPHGKSILFSDSGIFEVDPILRPGTGQVKL